mgnify:CR=1 FL=1
MMGFGTGMMGGGFSIIFWILIIGVAYYFFKEYNRKNNHRHDNYRHDDHSHDGPIHKDHDHFDDKREIDHRIGEDNPEELARKRYAKGEISKEELNEILDNLNN